MIRVVVFWNRDDEIDEMLRVSDIIREALREENLYNGTSTMNDPPKTKEIHLRNQRVPYKKVNTVPVRKPIAIEYVVDGEEYPKNCPKCDQYTLWRGYDRNSKELERCKTCDHLIILETEESS